MLMWGPKYEPYDEHYLINIFKFLKKYNIIFYKILHTHRSKLILDKFRNNIFTKM